VTGWFDGLRDHPVMRTEPSVFADDVRYSVRRLNGDGQPNLEHGCGVNIGHLVLEDYARFHEAAEVVRQQMLELLRTHAPINVWRVGQVRGVIGALKSWDGEGSLFARTRTSHETQRGVEE
jgi:hypothetical protein